MEGAAATRKRMRRSAEETLSTVASTKEPTAGSKRGAETDRDLDAGDVCMATPLGGPASASAVTDRRIRAFAALAYTTPTLTTCPSE